jgi:hypothetical protein
MGPAQSTSEPFNQAGSVLMSDLGSDIRFVMTEVTKLEERVNNIVEDNRSHKKDLRWTWSGGVGAFVILAGMFLYGYNRLDDKITNLSNKIDNQITNLSNKIDGQNTTLNNKIDSQNANLNNKIDTLNNKMDNQNVEMMKMIMALNTKIDTQNVEMMKQNAEIMKGIAVLSARLDGLAERLPPSAVRKH